MQMIKIDSEPTEIEDYVAIKPDLENDQVESSLRNLVKQGCFKIWARNCLVRTVTNLANELDEEHYKVMFMEIPEKKTVADFYFEVVKATKS